MPVVHALPVALHSVAAQPAHSQPGRTQPHTTPTKPSTRPSSTAKKPLRTMTTTRIKAGDTVYGISRRMHSSVAAIVKANPGIELRRLIPGTTLRVPVPTAQAPKHTAAKKAKKPASTSTPSTRPATQHHAPKPKHVVTYAGTAAARAYPASVVAAGDRHRRQLATADLPDRQQVRSMIEATARRYGVNPTLALAIGWQESGHQQSAVSVCDALGVMQVMPSTGKWAGGLVHRDLNLFDTQDNITAGVATLRFLTEHARNQDEAIASYYQGLGGVHAHGMYTETRRYVASVNAHMKRFS